MIIKKVDCHIGWPVLTPGWAVMDRELGTPGESGIGAVFQLTVELFADNDSELSLFEANSASLNRPHATSMTQAGQCCLAPLTQVISDQSLLVSRPTEVQLVRWGAGGGHEGICAG